MGQSPSLDELVNELSDEERAELKAVLERKRSQEEFDRLKEAHARELEELLAQQQEREQALINQLSGDMSAASQAVPESAQAPEDPHASSKHPSAAPAPEIDADLEEKFSIEDIEPMPLKQKIFIALALVMVIVGGVYIYFNQAG